MAREFDSARDFAQSLTMRLRALATQRGIEVSRVRRQLAFERFLVRLQRHARSPWIVKGGHAMQLMFSQARSTVDLDLTATRASFSNDGELKREMLRQHLVQAAEAELGDFFEFRLHGEGRPLAGPKYAGCRFRVQALVDSKIFERFHVDVGVGEPLAGEVAHQRGGDWLEFAGVAAPTFRTISREQQFAEKVHAYTLPREVQNTRVKDLIDLRLLVESGTLHRRNASAALGQIFSNRGSHPLPPELKPPPPSWREAFDAMALECGLETGLEESFELVARFYRGISGGGRRGSL